MRMPPNVQAANNNNAFAARPVASDSPARPVLSVIDGGRDE